MTYDHQVANWEDGRIWFSPPQYIVRRNRLPDEKIVYLETKRRSIRVTGDHRMLYRSLRSSAWEHKHAIDLDGVVGEMPICGTAHPDRLVATQESLPLMDGRRRAANAYNIRKSNPGMSKPDSVALAEQRWCERRELTYADPSQLTDAELELIGFWLGDGSGTDLQSGGIEYRLVQGDKYPRIIARIDELLQLTGIDNIRRHKDNHVQWSLPRGTGFGSQRRNGVYRIEPYLNKLGTDLFWGLTKHQFYRLLVGYWMADGTAHRDDIEPSRSFAICGVRRQIFDLLQSIAVCRRFGASIRTRSPRHDGHLPLLTLAINNRFVHTLHDLSPHGALRVEDGWHDERVWCVTSDSGNIITRRNGSVTVMGNTEGYDNDRIRIIVPARPTMIESLYLQMIGRGTGPTIESCRN